MLPGHCLCHDCSAELWARAISKDDDFISCPICREKLHDGDSYNVDSEEPFFLEDKRRISWIG